VVTHVRLPPSVRVPAVLVAVLMVVPVAWLVVVAADLGATRAVELLASRRTLLLVGRTLGLATVVTVASVAIAVPIAWSTERTDLPLRRTLGVAAGLPLVVPTYVGAFALVSALGAGGLVEQVTGWRPPSPYGFWGAAGLLTVLSYPYVLLPVRAAIRGLDPALEEAARTLGRRRGGVLRHVVLPQLRPAAAAGGLLVGLYVMSDFGAVTILRTSTLTRAVFLQYRTAFDRAPAALLALVLVALAAAVLLLERRLGAGDRTGLARSGPARTAATVPLGPWRWPAAAAVLAVIAAGVLVPVGVIVWWLVRGLAAGRALDPALAPLLRTLAVALGAAVLAVAAAWPVALWSAREDSRGARIAERATWLGYALPGIVIAFALVSLGIRAVPFLYQTLAMLLVAYVVLFLPQAVGAIRAALLQVDRDIDAAARTLGAAPREVVRRVLLPLSGRGAVAGGALVALTVVKELPATLLLAPTGFDTLATRVWSATEEAFYARAAVPALLLIAVGTLPLTLPLLGRGSTPPGR
jgi:iron(III) transport system permease protein